MNLFQLFFLALAGLLLAGTVIATTKGWMSRREGFFSACIWVLAGLAVTWPDATTRVARFVGLGRGANLLLYCAVFVMMLGFFMIYIRLRQLRREMTLLVRHLALREAGVGDGRSALGDAENLDAEAPS